MTDQLNEWIAIHVMGWTRAKSEYGVEYYRESHEWCANYTPTTDPAQAMAVLEKCAEKEFSVNFAFTHGMFRFSLQIFGENFESAGEIGAESESLPEAICLFAKELFGP